MNNVIWVRLCGSAGQRSVEYRLFLWKSCRVASLVFDLALESKDELQQRESVES
jgi:hypothetical protein